MENLAKEWLTMRLKNSSTFDTALLREVVRFAKPAGVSGFDLEVKPLHYRAGYAGVMGRAYWGGCASHCSADPLVVVRISSGAEYPSYSLPGRGGYLPALFLSRDEEVLCVIAHELRHLWQAKHQKGWRVWGARGQFSERDADAYAIRKVREWRKIKRGG